MSAINRDVLSRWGSAELLQRASGGYVNEVHYVHGDPGDKNIFVNEGQIALIDWDEARVDTPWFDLAALPDDACPLTGRDRWIARQAASAWEAALAWSSERDYADWRLSQVAVLGDEQSES